MPDPVETCPHGADPDECFECVLARMEGRPLRWWVVGLVAATGTAIAALVTFLVYGSFKG